MSISLLKKLNPLWWFGNEKNPTPPDWFMPGAGKLKRKIMWFARNPFHNFMFFVLGCVDSDPQLLWKKQVYSWTFQLIHTKWMIYPFVNYWNMNTFVTKFYLGWRPDGAFGFKLNFRHGA